MQTGPKPDLSKYPEPNYEEREKLEAIFNTDPLYIPTDEDKVLLWKYRGFCMKRPKSVAKFVWCIPWGNSDAVQEAYKFYPFSSFLFTPVQLLGTLGSFRGACKRFGIIETKIHRQENSRIHSEKSAATCRQRIS
jgi:hypothetical protein